jgi:hypothetical protein
MPTSTYELIESVTLASNASTIEFASIAATYSDIIIQGQIRSTRAAGAEDLYLKMNADVGSNYSSVLMYGTGGSGAGSFTQTSSGMPVAINTTAANTAAGIYSEMQASVMDYSASDKHTSVLSRNGGDGQTQVWAGAHRWANNSAVTSLILYYKIGQIAAGTTISIYGIAG